MWSVLINSKVDGRKFNKPGVKKAEHEKVILAQLLDWVVRATLLMSFSGAKKGLCTYWETKGPTPCKNKGSRVWKVCETFVQTSLDNYVIAGKRTLIGWSLHMCQREIQEGDPRRLWVWPIRPTLKESCRSGQSDQVWKETVGQANLTKFARKL